MDLPALIRSAELLQIVKYVNVVSSALLMFDYCLTLGTEVELVWKSAWNAGKVLFLLARYTAIFNVPLVVYYDLGTHVSHKTCHDISAASAYSNLIAIAAAEAILVLRTCALCSNSRKMLISLFTFLAAMVTPCLVIIILFLNTLEYGEPPLSIIVGCYPTAGSVILITLFILLIFFETTIMSITLWLGVKRFRDCRNALIGTLYRDGIFFYIYIFLVSAGNIVVSVAGDPGYAELLNTFQNVMHSVLSTRIVLHVRAAARDSEDLFAQRNIAELSDLTWSTQRTQNSGL